MVAPPTNVGHAAKQTPQAAPVAVPIARLRESFRFDQELATILTRFQYQADGIDLTANAARPLPSVESPTAGVDAVFDAASSLVVVCYRNSRRKPTASALSLTHKCERELFQCGLFTV